MRFVQITLMTRVASEAEADRIAAGMNRVGEVLAKAGRLIGIQVAFRDNETGAVVSPLVLDSNAN
jgi:hypothetical protein